MVNVSIKKLDDKYNPKFFSRCFFWGIWALVGCTETILYIILAFKTLLSGGKCANNVHTLWQEHFMALLISSLIEDSQITSSVASHLFKHCHCSLVKCPLGGVYPSNPKTIDTLQY